MLSTHQPGGILEVVEGYRRDGLIDRWGFQSLWTHDQGTLISRLWMAFSKGLKLLILLLQQRVSFLHVHLAMRGSFWRKSVLMEMAGWFGVPSILHLHGSEFQVFYESLGPYRQRCIQRTLARAEGVIVLSEALRHWLGSIAPKAKVVVIPNYVPLKEIPLKQHRSKAFTVLFLGALIERKGISDLLHTFKSFQKVSPEARLLLAGTGDDQRLQALVETLGLRGSVEFLGWVNDDQKTLLLGQADCLVLPSYHEGMPMAILEAMALGLPVIATRVGGIPEVITHGVDGLLIAAGDRKALLIELLRLQGDPTLRILMGRAARSLIRQHFTKNQILPMIESLYRDVLEECKKGPLAPRKTPIKVLAVCSAGGHWVQLMHLRSAFEGMDMAFSTVNAAYSGDVEGNRFYLIQDVNRWDRLKFLRLLFELIPILWREKPDVVITTGAAPGLMALILGRLMGARTLWIDSLANSKTMSLSGRLARPFASVWLTQWPALSKPKGPDYWGSIL